MSTIKLFGKALISEKSNLSFDVVNKVAVTKGYVIHPDVCNTEVMEFLNKIPLNYNATFYTKWSEVIEKSRFDLFVDQIMHYCSTYGTNFQGDFYVPNQVNEIENFLFADLKVILPISAESASYRACEMLYSGIALSEETIQMLIPQANSVEIDRIKNKEALMYFCKELDVLPTDTVEFVRYLVFLGTGKTLLINDKATNMSLKANKINLTDLVNKFGIEKVASVFHRFKYVFLALKKGNESIVNKIRKLSKTYHKPMKIGFFEKLLSDPTCVVDLPKQLENCNNFKKILILETILRRKKGFDMRFFGIRNGKLWAKEEKMIDKKYYTVVYDIIYK